MILDTFNLDGKVAIVTGGGTNLGKAMCHALARAGADVVVAARTSGPLDETVDEVKAFGRRALAVPTDITDSNQVNNLIEKTITEFGALDILVNNAGIAKGIEPSDRDETPWQPGPIWELTDDMWHRALDINLTGTFYCCRAAAKQMIAQKSGKVINISSSAGLRAAKHLFTYCSAKAGVIMLTKALAYTWAKYNINVNCIAPGVFRTVEMDQKAVDFHSRMIPVGRPGEPEEMGPLAVFLASRASDYVTGECFIVDGARSAAYAPVNYTHVIPMNDIPAGEGCEYDSR
jgi:NAD(P)-dependent dehydrogenase (short-subunit alcohol dehydrogenase family)